MYHEKQVLIVTQVSHEMSNDFFGHVILRSYGSTSWYYNKTNLMIRNVYDKWGWISIIKNLATCFFNVYILTYKLILLIIIITLLF